MRTFVRILAMGLALSSASVAAQSYDLVIANGRVMDPASGLDAIRHVGIRDGRTATEVLRRDAVGADGETGRVVEEYAVLDRAGRLQLASGALAGRTRTALALAAPVRENRGMAKILVHLTRGPEDPTRAALAFLVGRAATEKGHEVSLFLAGDAVQQIKGGVLVPTQLFKAVYDPSRGEAGEGAGEGDRAVTAGPPRSDRGRGRARRSGRACRARRSPRGTSRSPGCRSPARNSSPR